MRGPQAISASVVGYLSVFSCVSASTIRDESSALKIEKTNDVSCSRPSRVGDQIAVHYRGRLLSTGVEFDESYNRGKPFKFRLGSGAVIKGWDQGLLDMCPGEGRTLTIPPEMAYGEANMMDIPPHSTLVFDTELVDIVGVKQETLVIASSQATVAASSTTQEEGLFSIATAPPVAPQGWKEEHEGPPADAVAAAPTSDVSPLEAEKQAECRLLGPFALLVQGALGAVALLTLVWKRYRESPPRPWRIFLFDVSKQVLGSMLTHVLNLAMSMLGSVAIVNAAQKAAEGHAAAATSKNPSDDVRMPNPCSFYLLNLAIDTTLGIPVLYLLLKVLYVAALRTPLARPPQSIKSGNYGQPPKTTWWLKQLTIYFIGLVGMKLFVFFLFSVLPWLPWVGDWALRWTKGNEALEVTFAMFIFPLGMNAIQYWVIDNFIMDKQREKGGYEQVNEDDEESSERLNPDAVRDGTQDSPHDERSHLKAVVDNDDDAILKEANPTPVPAYGHNGPTSGSASSRSVSKKDSSQA